MKKAKTSPHRTGNLRILVLNPGSTSTKVALFDGETERDGEVLTHSAEELSRFPGIWDQFNYRLEAIRSWFHTRADGVKAVVATGGLFRPVEGGTYRVNAGMLQDARNNLQGAHASNLGCALADAVAREAGCPAFVVDPVSVDEFEPVARISGHPSIERRSLSHAVSIHAVSRRAAKELHVRLSGSSFVVAHLGGGISIAAVRRGRIIDVNDASSDGPFSPERTGGLPLQQFITLATDGSRGEQDLRSLVMGKGGLVAYLGTNSAREVEKRIEGGDGNSEAVYRAMAYQISKEIGAMATVLHGTLNAVILTGGLASSKRLTGWIRNHVGYLGTVLVYPGDDEMRALALGALRVLRNEEEIKEY